MALFGERWRALRRGPASPRAVAVALLCAGAAIYYAGAVGTTYPIGDWLFWRLLVIAGWCALFNLACFSFGRLVVTRWLGLNDLPRIELAVTSLAVGLVGFTLAMYLAGTLGLFRAPMAIVLPLVMIAAGGPSLWRATRERSGAPRAGGPAPRADTELSAGWSRALTMVATVVGILGVLFLYLQCLSPNAMNYDARWYHLAIAQDYAREGRIVPFYADFNKCFPHLASLIHTWDFLVPGLSRVLRYMLALHQEFVMVLWAVAGVGAAAAWLSDRGQLPGAWAGFFLFPMIFVADSNIAGGADHVYGAFAVPLFLATMRALPDLSPRRCALVGILSAGATLTRYQAIYLLVPVAALIGGRALWLVARRRGQEAWRGPLAALTAGFVLALPHFLKNAIFYRNPFYPFGVTLFPGSFPRQVDTPLLSRYLFSGDGTIPRGTFFENLRNAVPLAFAGFSLRPPFAFGALFTLTAPLLPFLRGQRRLWLGAIVAWLALVTWGMTYPVDRYLQGVIPIIAGLTVAIVVRAWELGPLVRTTLLALVGLQVVWSGDIPFADGAGRLATSLELIRGGLGHGAATRFDGVLHAELAINRRLPRSAVVLFHNSRLSLGVDRKVLQDLPGFQGLIDCRNLHSVRELYQMYRGLGITHVLHEPGAWPAFSKQEDVLFGALLARHAQATFREGPYEVFALPAAPPPVEAPYRVLALGLGGYADGLYPIEALGTFEPMADAVKRFAAPSVPLSALSPTLAAVAGEVDAVIVALSRSVPPELSAILSERFTPVVSYGMHGSFTLYVRRAPRPPR